jgi:dolichol-phosphate mannosyltransferase
MRKLAIILPTYIEAVNLDAIVEEIGRALGQVDYEIIVADDDSPDLTWKKAEELSRTNDHVRVLRRKANFGLAPAVADGMALANSEFVACMDADLQHDSVILRAMLAELENGKTIAAGSRYVEGGGVGKWNLIRRFASNTATFAARIVTGIELKDPMSGYFMLRRSDFMKVRPDLNLRGFKILLEIASHLREPKIAEVPYTFRERHLGESKLTSKVIWNYLVQLTQLYRRLHPRRLHLFRSCVLWFVAILVNLSVFLAIIQQAGWRDWRASASGTFVAVLGSFAWRKWRPFRDKSRVQLRNLTGNLRFAASAFVTFLLTTAAFETLSIAVTGPSPVTGARTLTLAVCQLVSILFSICTAHVLNHYISWRHEVHNGSFAVKASNQ